MAGGASINYSFAFNIGSLIITPATLTATAVNKTKEYGDANPSLTINYVGFMGAENAGNLTSQPVLFTSVNTMSDVGTYDITLTGGSSPNYTIVLVNGVFTVTKATLNVTAVNKSKVYGDANPLLTINYTGFKGSDNATSLSTQPSISSGASNFSNVGSYAITLAGGVSSNYTIILNNGVLTITQASLNAIADNKSKVYGDANPTLTITYIGFKGSDNVISSVTAEPSISTVAVTTSNVGSYTITLSGGVSSNYSFSLTNGTMTITKAALTATAVDKTKVYGDVNPTLTISYIGFKAGDIATSLTAQPLISTTANTTSGVGSYAITLSGGTSSNYTITLVSGTLTVGKAIVTATASNASRLYDVANPSFVIIYSGFVNGDAVGVLNVLPTASTIATISSPVGTYSIDVAGGTDDNYSFAYVSGILTIGKATPVINWSNPSNIIYGTPLSATQLNASALVPGTFVYTPVGGTILNVGVSQSLSVNFNPTDAVNYNPAAKTVFITVIKATPLITWPTPLPIKVNEALSALQLNATSNGVAGVFVYTPSVGASFGSANTYTLSVGFTPTDAGNYNSVPVTQVQIVVSLKDNPVITWPIPSAITYGTLLSASQLNANASVSGSFSYTPALGALLNTGSNQTLSVSFIPVDATNFNTVISSVSITVNKANLTATAASTTRIYGASNPTFVINYSGFVNSETAGVIDTAPIATCSAINNDTAGGVFPIIPGGGVDNNYSLTYVNGSLTITKAPLTAKADNKSRSYGLPNPTNTISYTGFVNGDTEAGITQPAASTTATVLSNVGSVPITLSGGSATNYNLTLQSGTLTINASALIATASNVSKVYGQVNPALTIVYSGFLNGDNVSSITPPTATTPATTASGVGVYSISLSGGSALNYGIILQSGNLTITKAPLTVTANNKTRVYGAANPALTFSYSGFVNSDNASVVTPSPVANTSAISSSPVGVYSITASGGSAVNYSFNYVSGVLTITKATITATANNQSRAYGASNPTLDISYSGFVNTDMVSDIDSAPTANTSATSTSTVGTYAIIASGGVDNNYNFSYVSGTLTIATKALTVMANSTGRMYGAANPSFTVSYSGFANSETAAVLSTAPTATSTAVGTTPVGTAPITASGGIDANYNFSYVSGTLTIATKTLTVRANSTSRIYGAANPSFTVSYSGFANSETPAVLTTAPTAASSANGTTPVGTAPITASGGIAANYNFAYVSGVLTITKAIITATANNKGRAYGASNPTLDISYSGFVNTDMVADIDSKPTANISTSPTSNVGVYPITVSGGLDNNYSFNFVSGNLTISKAILIATAANVSRSFGAANPTFVINYSGFVNGETESVLDVLPTAATTATTASPIGNYPITVSGGSDNNYLITPVNGVLTINLKTTPDIIWATPADITYGTGLSATQLNATASISGSPIAGVFTYSHSSGTVLDAGLQTLSVDFVPTDGVNFNSVIGSTVQITVTKATPIISWVSPAAITYGSVLNSLQLNATSNVAGTFAYLSASGTLLNAGSQALTVNFIPTNIANYTSVSGTTVQLIVNRATPVITWPVPASITYGTVLSALQLNASADVGGSFAYTPAIGVLLNAGNSQSLNAIFTPTDIVNYNIITNVTSAITVNKKSAIVSAIDQNKIYGSANPTLNFGFSGFANNETATVIDALPAATTTATLGSSAGIYPITVSGGTDNNYSFAYVAGNLTINKAQLKAKADDKRRTLGEQNPIFTISYSGFVNGDSENVLDVKPTASSTAIASSIAGVYDINVSGGLDNNYVFDRVVGKLSIYNPPVLKNFEVQTPEDSQLDFKLNSFSSNFDNQSGDPIASLKITVLPAKGKLSWKGKVIVANDVIIVSNGSFEAFVYQPNSDYNGSDSFLWNASDGFSSAVSVATTTIKISPVNDPPVLSTSDLKTIEYSPGDPALPIAKSMIINDVDNTNIFSASISLVENFASGDELSFQLSTNSTIKSSFDKASGKLTLTGKDLKSNYEIALANVLFNSSVSNNSTLLVKKLTVSVNDSIASSNLITKDIQITEILPELSLVNSFTPNDDGVNDFWDIGNLQFYKKIAISIFDQSGVGIYTCSSADCKWDGKYSGKVMPTGSYLYVIDLNDSKRKYQGSVTILK